MARSFSDQSFISCFFQQNLNYLNTKMFLPSQKYDKKLIFEISGFCTDGRVVTHDTSIQVWNPSLANFIEHS